MKKKKKYYILYSYINFNYNNIQLQDILIKGRKMIKLSIINKKIKIIIK
jgi:hypothetical protein